MKTKVERSRKWARPKPGTKGAVCVRYASMAGISPATARDHFRTRTYSEPPHAAAKMLRASFAEQNYHSAGTILHPIYEEILRVSIGPNAAEVLHRCVCIDDAEQLPGREYIHDSTDANRKQWLRHLYPQLTATVKAITVLEGQAP